MGADSKGYDERASIEAAAQGCHAAFTQLVMQHQDYIFQVCFRLLGCQHDARDACQDTFLKAYNALPRFRNEAKFSTWLYQIALNCCRDRWKRNSGKISAKSQSLEHSHLSIVKPESLPNASLEWSDEVKKLEQSLNALPAKYREIIILSCVEELSHAECAVILECSERAVEGRLRRAREALREIWKRNE